MFQKVFNILPKPKKGKWIVNLQKLMNCLECGKWFLDLKKFTKHKKTHIKTSEEFDLEQDLKRKVNCISCRKTFVTKGSHNIHKEISHFQKTNCNRCEAFHTAVGKKGNKADVSKEETSSGLEKRKDLKCLKCDKQFSFKRSLTRHGKESLEEAVKCEICKMMFCFRQDLTIHQNTVHKIFPHNCKQCGKYFNAPSKLKRHIQVFHDGIRYKCDKCGNEFSRKDYVYDHKRRVHQSKS